jgi:hypothetical protein
VTPLRPSIDDNATGRKAEAMATNISPKISGLTAIEPASCSTASVIIEDWLGDEEGTWEEHWEAEAYTLLRARPQRPGEAMFSLRKYHMTVATAEIMRMETDNEKDVFCWLIEDDETRDEIGRGYAVDMLSAQRDCERKMHEIAAMDRA